MKQWADRPGLVQGPYVTTTVGPAVISRGQKMFVFATSTDQQLYVNAWDGEGSTIK